VVKYLRPVGQRNMQIDVAQQMLSQQTNVPPNDEISRIKWPQSRKLLRRLKAAVRKVESPLTIAKPLTVKPNINFDVNTSFRSLYSGHHPEKLWRHMRVSEVRKWRKQYGELVFYLQEL
jgi:ribonuclease D